MKTVIDDGKSRGAIRKHPLHSLEEALVVAMAIREKNAGKPMKRLLVADAINIKPASTNYRDLLSSSFKYGLTNGTEKAEEVSLTPLGESITLPTSNEALMEARQKAALTPDLFRRIFAHYNNGKFPMGTTFFTNTLQAEFGVAKEHAAEVAELLEKNGKYAGIIRDITGSPHVMLGDFASIPSDKPASEQTQTGKEEVHSSQKEPGENINVREKEMQPPRALPIFIAHGKDKKPVEQLKKILDQFKIQYKIAVDEAHGGRPISQKVRDLMQGCGSAIFIFSKNGEPNDTEWGIVPNLNVVFELGAASVLYGEKIVIFKEEGIKLPSDFNDLGYIAFEANHLDAKAMDLLKELISMGMVKILPT